MRGVTVPSRKVQTCLQIGLHSFISCFLHHMEDDRLNEINLSVNSTSIFFLFIPAQKHAKTGKTSLSKGQASSITAKPAEQRHYLHFPFQQQLLFLYKRDKRYFKK